MNEATGLARPHKKPLPHLAAPSATHQLVLILPLLLSAFLRSPDYFLTHTRTHFASMFVCNQCVCVWYELVSWGGVNV